MQNYYPMRVPKSQEIRSYLLKLGVRPNQIGFVQLTDAVELWCEGVSPECVVPQISKSILPVIARQHKTTVWAVDANLRHALHNLQRDGHTGRAASLLHASPSKPSGVYTPGEFVALVSLALQDPFVPIYDAAA